MPFVTLFLLLLAIGGIAWLGIVPLKQSLEEKMRGIQEFHAGRENRERQVSRLPELRGQYEVITENEKTLDILITEDQVVDFVKTVERLAGEMNVAMSIASKDGGKIIEPPAAGAKPDPSKAADILAAVPFDRYLSLSVKVEGRYDDIVAFLSKVETLPFGLDVIRVEMKKKDTENDSRSSAARSTSNPFAMLGDSDDAAQAASPAGGKDALEAVFDILVYVKKTDL